MKGRNIMIILFVFFASFLLYKEYTKEDNEIILGDTLVGDVDGNGKVGASDYIAVRKHILKQSVLTGDKLSRADVDNNGKVGSSDYIMIRKIIMGTITVTPRPTTSKSATIPTASSYCNSLTYNGKQQTLVKTAGIGYTWTSGTTRTNAGSQDVIATLSSGYKWSDNTTGTKKITCSIGKATPTPPTLSDKTYTYDGGWKLIGVSGGTSGLTIEWTHRVWNGSSWGAWVSPWVASTAFSSQNVGKYETKCRLKGNDNYNDSAESNTAILTINAAATPTPKPTTSPAKIHFVKGRGDTFSIDGDSDIILIESNGHYGLVDAGNDNGIAVNYLQSVGVKNLDFIISTHSHPDHIGGMSAIADKYVNFNTTYYYREVVKDSYCALDSSLYSVSASVAKKMSDKGATLKEVTGKNPTFTMGDFSFEILNTDKAKDDEKRNGKIAGANKDSIVTYVLYKGGHGTLLTGDMESQDEYRMVSNDTLKNKPVDVLKVAHHSWQSSTTMKFTKYIKPKIAIVTGNYLLDDISTSVYYMQQKYGTKFYITGKSDGAVIIDYANSLSVSPSKSLVDNYSIAKSDGNWRKLQNGIWFYLDNVNDLNTIVYDAWRKSSSNKWYYFSLQGNMMTGWAELKDNGTPALYYLGTDGAMVTGWAQPKEISPYNNSIANNYYETGWYTDINYTFDAWYTYNSKWANGSNWFYFDSSGRMVTGWQKLSDKWYYFDGNGVMASDKCLTLSNVRYCFDKSGACTTGC